jgi:RNA polymerase sigma-70 factor (ECF subfamily)
MRDEDLVTAFLKGRETAFEDLRARYERRVFYTVKGMVRDSEEAKEITQETFIRIFKNLRKLRKKEHFRIWLFRIALNLARDHLRGKKQQIELENWMEVDGRASPETDCIHGDLRGKVKEAVHHLPPRQREVVILRIFRELDFSEIARIMETKPETARAHFHFAIKKLRETLRMKGITHEL